MATRQPGQAGVTVDQLGYLHHADDPYPVKTNDTGDSGVAGAVIGTVITAGTGGTLGAAVATSYKVTALTAVGESTPGLAAGVTTGGGTTNTVTVPWTKVPGATGYKVYGRTAAAWGLLATVGDVASWLDTGAASPGAVPPVTNTSGNLAAGVEPGNVVGDTLAAAITRPTVDTRNATNVGAPSGPDTEAPRQWS